MKVFLGLLQLCILFSAIRTTPSLKCEPEWKLHGTTCYVVLLCGTCVPEYAERVCPRGGATVVKFASPQVQNAVLSWPHNGYVYMYIGGKYSTSDKAWKWPDGTPLSENDDRWAPGEPKNGKNCMYVRRDQGLWYSIGCRVSLDNWITTYMCEKPASVDA